MLNGVLLDGEIEGKQDLSRVKRLLTRALTAWKCQLSVFELRKMDIAPCQGCFGCWIRTPGECLIADESQEIVRVFTQADLLALLSPVTFGGYSSELKKALDRGICFVSPFFMTIQGETHHKPRYDRAPRLLAVGVTAEVDEECRQIFKSLVHRNAINFHSPRHAVALVDVRRSDEEINSDLERALAELEIP